ncbi:MAG: hypothetical protein KME02_02015 [Aphanothece saxicola GSE-SYN-MK-01-06B]|jgi:hypothetical protein|nr:hypothetical protein [Aphanothece saxicola GSE-SYN-MK-01-06B]
MTTTIPSTSSHLEPLTIIGRKVDLDSQRGALPLSATNDRTTAFAARIPVLRRRLSEDWHEIDLTTSFYLKGDDFGMGAPTPTPYLASTPKIEENWFIEDMTDVWVSRGNTISDDLIKEWTLLCDTFNKSLLDTKGSVYTYNGSCGIGKSQAAHVACAILAASYFDASFTGINFSWGAILIVERIQTAEKTAREINLFYQDITGRSDQCAVAKHSQSEVSFNDIYNYPILVICHKAYSNSLQRLSDGNASTMRSFARWRYGQRMLVIVDESINPISEYQLTLSDYNRVDGYFVQGGLIPSLSSQHPSEWAVFKAIGPVLEQIQSDAKASPTVTSSVFNRIVEEAPARVNLQQLYATLLLGEYAWDQITLRRESATVAQEVRANIKSVLQAIDRLVNDWSYSTKSGLFQRTNAATWLLSGDEVGSMVILDGTASQDMTYDFLPNRVEVMSNKCLRNLEDVTLHIKQTPANLGKSGCKESNERDTRVIELYESLKMNPNLGRHRKVLFVANISVENCLTDLSQADPYFDQFETTHWGATTGENCWADCDAVVIASCFYRPPEWAANTLCSQLGLAEGLEQLSRRGHSSLVKKMINSKVAVDMIQALYRSQIRRVIDGGGRCHPTDLFVLLPSDERGDSIKAMLLDELPNVTVKEWDFSGFIRARKPKGNDLLKEAAFLRVLVNLPVGRTRLVEFLELADISRNAWNKTWGKRVSGDTPGSIAKRAKELGIELNYSGFGRSRQVYVDRVALAS